LTTPHPAAPPRVRRLWIALAVGASYALVGLAASAMSGRASSPPGRTAWRLAAWAASVGAFLVQVVVGRARLRIPARSAAADAALAAALGALVLAAVAIARSIAHGALGPRLALALVLWPVLVAIPAFVIGFGLAAMITPRVGA